MPFCELFNDIRLHYITNTPNGDVSDLDYEKPVVLLLSANTVDVTWYREQFRDARLSGRYNLIGIDLLYAGKSKAPFSPKQDAWVDAADIAVFHETLHLPPCHFFGCGTGSCGAAMSFAVLFPERCLSLFLCAPAMQKEDEPPWVGQARRDFVEQLWCFPPDLEAFHCACTIMIALYFNNRGSLELHDEMVTWWQKHYSPRHSTTFVPIALRGTRRIQYSEQELQSIRVPTFILQGDMALLTTPEYARSLSDQFPNSKFVEVKGGPEFFAIVPEYATVVNRLFVQFLGSMSHTSTRQTQCPDPQGMCKAALARLAVFANDPSFARRDPTSTLSFSRLSSKYVSKAADLFHRCAQAEKDAIDPLDEHGEPILKYSEMYKGERGAEYLSRIRGPMGVDEVTVRVESCTVLESETQ